jgi:lambda repressor-like predicted transcriptional regulator
MRTDQSLASKHGSGGSSAVTSVAEPPIGPPKIEVKQAAVAVLLQAADWSMAELARRARLDQSAVARLIRRDLRPGPRLIAGLLVAFSTRFPKIGFYDLFELVEEDGTVLFPQADALPDMITAGEEERSA